MQEKIAWKKNEKGGHRTGSAKLGSIVGGHPLCAFRALPKTTWQLWIRPFSTPSTACSLAGGEAAPILARLYMSPPADLKNRHLESIPPSVLLLLGILVNSSESPFSSNRNFESHFGFFSLICSLLLPVPSQGKAVTSAPFALDLSSGTAPAIR